MFYFLSVLFTDDAQSRPHSNGSDMTPSAIPMSVQDTSLLPVCPSLPALSTPMPTTSTSIPSLALCAHQVDTPMAGPPDTLSPAPSLFSGESEEDKAKKLLYCSLCKVAVNSLSQLEAHNKGKAPSKDRTDNAMCNKVYCH